MRITLQGPAVTWIDVLNPTEEDAAFLAERAKLHALTAEELVPPAESIRVEVFPHYLFLVLHDPVYDKEKRETRPRELDIILTKDMVATLHYQTIDPLKVLLEKTKNSKEEQEKILSEKPEILAYTILHRLWESHDLKLSRISKKLHAIEQGIFEGRQKEMLKEISLVKTDILNFWRTVKPQRRVIVALKTEAEGFLPEEFVPYANHLLNHWRRVANDLQLQKETIRALEETNNALLTNRTNEIVRTLTMLSVILLPLTLVASVFGMNTALPLDGSILEFWFVLIFMGVLTVVMLLFFKSRRWI